MARTATRTNQRPFAPKRGELVTPLPVRFVYDSQGRVQVDPDREVQQVRPPSDAAHARGTSSVRRSGYFGHGRAESAHAT